MFLLFLLLCSVYGQYFRPEQTPCCSVCKNPQEKYFSVDHGWGHPPFCGETCLVPSKYSVFHIFERNLTASNISHPCAQQFTPNGHKYSKYNSTVTHGFPGLSITLDLYGPDNQ